jgi:transcriptional regulator GlxA family with amidase domain
MDYRIESVVAHILQNLKSPMTICKMAEMSNLSKDHFTKLFKNETEMSPIQFIRHQRLEKAKEFLETTNLRVKEIICQFGISDQSHFVRDFKEKYRLKPNQYRQKYWDDKKKQK